MTLTKRKRNTGALNALAVGIAVATVAGCIPEQPEPAAERAPDQEAAQHMLLASGLSVEYLTREAGNKTDMIDFWPYGSSNPTHLISCVEGGREIIDGADKYNPSVQRIDLATGAVATILRGMDRCDGVRTTAWGTILATEETSDGSAYEILDPLASTNLTITDRGVAGAAATIVDAASADASAEATKRFNLPVMAWEGLTVLENGVIIGGDELRPGSYEYNGSVDTDGGAIYKFIPDTLAAAGMIGSLSESPLVSGSSYALQSSCRDSRQQVGQGCEIGTGTWVAVDAVNARVSAFENGATGFYRPEDLHADPSYSGEGVRFCWANTGNRGAQNWGEVICGVDANPASVTGITGEVVINRFVEGDDDFNAHDNLAFHPSGVLYVIEDNSHGDIFACLPDGADRDVKTDGCVKVLSLHDITAEPTGFTFSPDGSKAYLSIQHSNDAAMPAVDNYATDDVVVISGFDAVDTAAQAAFSESKDSQLKLFFSLNLGFTPLTDSSSVDTNRIDSIVADALPADGISSLGEDASVHMSLASGLSATYVTRLAGDKTDMMDFWPYGSSAPTHLISCVEGGREIIDGDSKYNPSVQRIDLATGAVETVLRGMDRCDGVRSTAWGTILATEETTDGSAYEILDPLASTNLSIADRGTAGNPAVIVDALGNDAAAQAAKRYTMPVMAWEGLTILPSGVVIGGDELRPGSYELNGTADTDGGALFKYIPTTLAAGGVISSLSDSPLVSGNSYAFQASCRGDRQQFGQGCEIGTGTWVAVDAADARVSAFENAATGYYRPEDLHMDPTYSGPGVRFCWANTGNRGAQNWGEVICGVDANPETVTGTTGEITLNRFIEGDADLNAPDNLAFQPGTGILYVIEDNSFGDVWACLPDGDDRDVKSDGCVKVLSLTDTSAEPTGFLFDATGTTAYVSVQHSSDEGSADTAYDNYQTDDLVKIEGFLNPAELDSSSVGELLDLRLRLQAKSLFGFSGPIVESSTVVPSSE